jgi:hypothetical protein
MFLFIIGSIAGAVGIVLMVRGARVIRTDPLAASQYHWWGILILTFTAFAAWETRGDGSYLLMHWPILFGVGKTWLQERGCDSRLLRWWNAPGVFGFNCVLMWVGWMFEIISSLPAFILALGATTLSTAFAMKNRRDILPYLIAGRVFVLVASFWRLCLDPLNVAAWIWFGLMAWAIWDNLLHLKKPIVVRGNG